MQTEREYKNSASRRPKFNAESTRQMQTMEAAAAIFTGEAARMAAVGSTATATAAAATSTATGRGGTSSLRSPVAIRRPESRELSRPGSAPLTLRDVYWNFEKEEKRDGENEKVSYLVRWFGLVLLVCCGPTISHSIVSCLSDSCFDTKITQITSSFCSFGLLIVVCYCLYLWLYICFVFSLYFAHVMSTSTSTLYCYSLSFYTYASLRSTHINIWHPITITSHYHTAIKKQKTVTAVTGGCAKAL